MKMTNHKRILGASAISLTLTGTAMADVTSTEVWDSWKSYAESVGQTITVGTETTNGDTLTLKDIVIAMDFPDGKFSGTLEQLEFQQRGDGTVAISMSPDYPFAISMNPPDAEEIDLGLILRQRDLSLIASGAIGEIVYDYSASQLTVDVDKLFVGGKDFAPKIGFGLNNVDGNYKLSEGEKRQIESAMSADDMTMNVDFVDPNTGAKMVMSGTLENLSNASTATLPMTIDMEDPSWVFGEDFGATGQFSNGLGKYTINAFNGTDTVAIEGESTSANLDFALNSGMIAYGGTAIGTEYRISGSQIPFPQIKIGMDETTFDLKLPMKQTDQPSDFGLLTKIVGLYVSDEIWMMLDPGRILPHDPATAIIDVSGKLKWLLDLGDPEAMANADGEAPAELHAVTINDITLAVAGASIAGKGDFSFDPSDTTTFDGMPAPTGAVDFTIVGANGLIDKLIQMGFLPEDQAMGARMMLGMFARPGNGPDTLVSKFEVNGDGSVFANGQQIK